MPCQERQRVTLRTSTATYHAWSGGMLWLHTEVLTRRRPHAVSRVTADIAIGSLKCVRGLHLSQHALVTEGLRSSDRAVNLARRLGDPQAFSYAVSGLIAARVNLVPTEDETWSILDAWFLEEAVVVGHREATELLLHRLANMRSYASAFGGIQVFARYLGAAAGLLGKPDKARTYYAQAMDVATKLKSRPEMALIRFALAELLLERYPDEIADALDHLDFAISEFREMKCNRHWTSARNGTIGG
jgi:hypothetical protein